MQNVPISESQLLVYLPAAGVHIVPAGSAAGAAGADLQKFCRIRTASSFLPIFVPLLKFQWNILGSIDDEFLENFTFLDLPVGWGPFADGWPKIHSNPSG